MEIMLVFIILLASYGSVDSAVIDHLLKNQNHLKPVPFSLSQVKEQIESTINEINKALVLSDKNPSFISPCIWRNCPGKFSFKYLTQKENVNFDSSIQRLQKLRNQIRKYKTLIKLENDKLKERKLKVDPYFQSYQLDETSLSKLLELNTGKQ
jgi:hypothetical protein